MKLSALGLLTLAAAFSPAPALAAQTSADGYACSITYYPSSVHGPVNGNQGYVMVTVTTGDSSSPDICAGKVLAELEFSSPGSNNGNTAHPLLPFWFYSNSELQSLQDRLYASFIEQKKVRFIYDNAVPGALASATRQGMFIQLGIPGQK